MTTNDIKNTKKEGKTNAKPVVKNRSKNKKNKRKKNEEDDFEATLKGICPEYYERAKRRLREGKIINPLWYCITRHWMPIYEEGWTSDYF